MALVTAANVFNIGADLGSMAAAVRLLVAVPALAALGVIALGSIALEVFVSYHRYSRILRWLTASLLPISASTAISRHSREGLSSWKDPVSIVIQPLGRFADRP